jgi:hypothetical protein
MYNALYTMYFVSNKMRPDPNMDCKFSSIYYVVILFIAIFKYAL